MMCVESRADQVVISAGEPLRAETAEEPQTLQTAGFSLSRVTGLHIMTLFTLAVAHPLYAVLGHSDHAPFFIARQSRAIDLWLFVLFLSFLLPAALCLAIWLAKLLSPRSARALYALLVAFLLFALFLPIPEKLGVNPGHLTVGLALSAAALVTVLYLVANWARTFVSFMSVTMVLSPLVFFSSESVKSFLSTPEAGDYKLIPSSARLPNVVMIVFDELPLISLLDEKQQIDEVRYPNFHRLAKTATWYRNTTSVHLATSNALGSLLVGGEFQNYLKNVHRSNAPPSGPIDRERVPSSLFSLLENDYRVFAVELMTKLAPESAETGKYVPPLPERMLELVADSSIVYGHMVTPKSFRQILPAVEGQWRSFLGAGSDPSSGSRWPYADSHKRLSRVKQFFDLLQKRNEPSFYFLHSLLPHFPFVYNEHGQLHVNKLSFMTMHFREATGSNDWLDETTANVAYQAHLLQLSFTDLLLGRILDRLAELDLFEEALLVVTSDHGTSFYWDSAGLPPDRLAQVQASGTMHVPLMIKLPGQRKGSISDGPVQTIDVVPTIADVLQIKIPWETGGVSALESTRPELERFAYLPGQMNFGAVVDSDTLALKRKIELFGSHSFDGIYSMGPYGDIVGRLVTSFPSRSSSGTIKLQHPERYPTVDPTGPRVPAYVEGQIENLPEDLGKSELTIAVAVNGVIHGTTKTTRVAISSLTPQKGGQHQKESATIASDNGAGRHFLLRVPPKSFVKGRNEITVHAVVKDQHGRAAALITFAAQEPL